MGFYKGDSVVMINCGEAAHHVGKVWICRGDSFRDINNEEVIFLEGFSGYFHCRFLTNDKQVGTNEIRDMNNRINISADDVDINGLTLVSSQHDCSISVIEYDKGYEQGEELDLEVWYEGSDYKIPSNALRIAAQLLEIAEHKGVINT